MKFKKYKDSYFVRLDKGEKIIESLNAFLKAENIESGFFMGIGAVSHATTKFYSHEKKAYIEFNFQGEYEITSLAGNITKMDGKSYIHAHITLSDPDMKAFGGHLHEATVGATCELIVRTSELDIKRKFDEDLNLNVMDI
ncbi:MAG: DNA-binding protein [Nanoarchaeota archaeon]|nr:DNA-binding protein [Nanoarchaeota archaeon]